MVYILVWMCILYTGPGILRKDKHVSNTVLKPWVTVANNLDAVNLRAIKATLKSDPSIVTDEFTPFFKPLCPIVDKLLMQLGNFLRLTIGLTTELSGTFYWRVLAQWRRYQTGVPQRTYTAMVYCNGWRSINYPCT